MDTGITAEPIALVEAVLAAGIGVVQYRAKDGIDGPTLQAMLRRTRDAGARLVVNDDLEAALLADGWHAGQEDLLGLDIGATRAALGERLFGISCGLPEECVAAEAAGADYIGAGPYAATASKRDAGPAIGAAGIARVVQATRLPVVAIGGIGLDDIPAVAATGAAMAAVISAIAQAADPGAAAAALVARWAAWTP